MKIKFKIVVYSLVFFAINLSACARSTPHTNSVKIGKTIVNVELAIKPDELARGLQHRQSLKDNEGMLFIFSNSAKQSFWMKDTLISLDMIWMDYGRKVVYIAENVPPCKADPCPVYTPDEDAMYVMEVGSGFAKRYGVKKGDLAEFFITF